LSALHIGRMAQGWNIVTRLTDPDGGSVYGGPNQLAKS
jgi:hypothetical protein